MPKFRKKPVVIEAMQYPGDDWTIEKHNAFNQWLIENQGDRECKYMGPFIIIPTLEGDHEARPGDWIIRGVKGELYPCKPDIFEATYEPAD